ncbi:MAG: glycosyl hydrolase 115 family protein [Clostridium sp.]|nr:glycosyl hydrolase 115 family protein [Clostridium sp.]
MKLNLKTISAIAFSLMAAVFPGGIAAEMTVTSQSQPGAFPIVAAGKTATIVVDASDAEVVSTIAEAVSSDIELITGRKLPVVNSLDGVAMPVIAGTIGQSVLIDDLARRGKINTSEIAGQWESFVLETVKNPVDGVDCALVAYGSNPRATAYALLEISRLAGVSPYVWWADIAPEQRDELYATTGRVAPGSPSVRFRGIFINDEDWGLTPWASKNIDSKYNNIGPNTYAKVMEMLLRLRANVLWPAMHLCSQAFWDNKDNLPVAKKYDIALGSSHCEQMLRDNEWEWRRYEDGSGTYDNWNYVTNKAKIQRYWEERVAESKGFSAMYTLGMRGVHDWAISGYPTTEDKVRGLTEIIDFQRSLLAKHIGDPTTVPQIFIPYKEVLDAYNAGLQVPEDVILTWVDDNHGYVRQYPTAKEQQRSGGHGVYYHLSYYGTPSDYLWICSTAPALISYELVKGYENGIRDLWVINVGDIKPAEAELEFCMDLAWDVERWRPEKAHEYMRWWAAKTFGEDVADDIADIKEAYYRLGSGGKPEHVFGVNYTNYEMDNRIAEYKRIVDLTEKVRGSIPDRLQDAYFELIEYPVKGAYYMNVKTFRAKQSLDLAAAGDGEKAMEYAAEARLAYRLIDDITEKFNTGIAGGKWNGVMDSKPRQQSQFYMPQTASEAGVSPYKVPTAVENIAVVPAAGYTSSRGSIKEFKGLGPGVSSVAVWPIDEKSYSTSSLSSAPYVEYSVPVVAGSNTIQARFLPTFPLHSGQSMNVAVAVGDETPVVCSLKTVATEGKWNTTVLQGFNDATVTYEAPSTGNVAVRVYLLDPAIALGEIFVTRPEIPAGTDVTALLVNPDFELDHDGRVNPRGNVCRGIPFGWNSVGELKKGANGLDSYGINEDAKNIHGNNVCWINSVPMPSEYELSQTVQAEKLPPGYYLVRCRLWVEPGKLGNCRLFANDAVQYFGNESDYTNILTPGETNSYAGYTPSSNMTLCEMSVVVEVGEGENLKLGIRSSNKRNSGDASTSDNSGWFKVDHFRIDRVDGAPAVAGEDLTLTEQLIENYDFETYVLRGKEKEATSGTKIYGVPYKWSVNGSFPGSSYGINDDGSNYHSNVLCWFKPSGGTMPEDFELYQTIPAEKLTPGRYKVCCRLWGEEKELSTLRLFANNSVQYFGMEIDYDKNLTPGESETYACWVGGRNGDFQLQEMSVIVDIAEGEDLKLGIRSSNILADGTPSTREATGWFKTDFFRIHRLGATSLYDIAGDSAPASAPVYNLQGVRVASDASDVESLPKGIYVTGGSKILKP